MVKNLMDVMGETVRRRRIELGLTVGALAESSNVDIGTISRTENGHTQLTLDTAVRLCRALGLSLSDLVGDSSPWRGQFASRELEILESDIVDLLNLYRRDPRVCEEMLSRWVDLIESLIDEPGRPTQKIAFRAIGLANMVGEHPLFHFSMRLPAGRAAQLIPEIQWFGGKLWDENLQSLISAITADPEIYRSLSRQDKDVLRRLQSSTPDRIRYADVVELSKTLKVDLLGVFGNTVDLDELPPYIDDSRTEQETRTLITMFLIVGAWLRKESPNDSEWLQLIRRDLTRYLAAMNSQ